MKKNHGRSILLLLIFTLLYGDSGFEYKFDISNQNPYIKEPITLTVDISQKDHSKVMLFKFDIKKSDEYIFWRIDTKSRDEYHNNHIKYTYLLYPLKDGKIDINFNLIQMITTDDKVAYSFSGDRDNTRGLNKKDIPITIPPLSINIKPIPPKVDIVGDFGLSYHIKREKAKSYEPLALRVTINGSGYIPKISNLIPPSKLYTIFAETPIVKSINHKDTTLSEVIYNLALSAKDSFELEPIIIKAFNPKTAKYYELKVPKHSFEITKPDIDKLIDTTDSPKPIDDNLWSKIGSFISYLLVFIAGFISAKLIKWGKKSNRSDEVEDIISSTKNPKELLAILMATDRVKYKERIEKLERDIYR